MSSQRAQIHKKGEVRRQGYQDKSQAWSLVRLSSPDISRLTVDEFEECRWRNGTYSQSANRNVERLKLFR